MRKKSLRAMTSAVFEAPESRAEAIMQNILGANNVLVPPESPFEEILQAILYNTPYTKEAEARIEEILLAIKNNGTYYGEPQSRDEEILISKLNQTPYTKDAESRIEELFILWAAQSVIKQLEGVPPLTFTAQGQPLINWTIYGTSGGVGDKTANLFDGRLQQGFYAYIGGNYNSSTAYVCTYQIPCKSNTMYTFKCLKLYGAINYGFVFFNSNRGYAGEYHVDTQSSSDELTLTTKAPQNCAFLAINISRGTDEQETFPSRISEFMLNEGSTALPYELYGYKIPVSCGGETNTIYLDTPLYDGNSISMADTGIEIPTTNGQNTLAVDTTVQPEKVYIEYK